MIYGGVNEILPAMYDKKGVSVLTVNSTKAKQIFEKIKYNDMIKYNPAFVTSANVHPKREEFFKRYQSEKLNKLIPLLLNEKPLVVNILRKIFKKNLNIS